MAASLESGGTASSWRPRVLATVGVAAALGMLLWGGGRPWQSEGVTPEPADGAVVLAEDLPTSPSRTPPPAAPTVPPRVPPEERTNVVCSDLRPRSVPTADLDTDEPGELVQIGDRTCVVMRPEGVAVP